MYVRIGMRWRSWLTKCAVKSEGRGFTEIFQTLPAAVWLLGRLSLKQKLVTTKLGVQ